MILDIFAQNAHSQEGKAQVELAQLRYRLPRLRRGASGQAVAAARRHRHPLGPGETKLEVDRRRIMRRITKLEADLEGPVGDTRSCSARAATAAAWPRSRSSATRTPASRRCSTGSPTPACSSRTGCSPRSTRRTRRLAAARRRDGAADRHRRLRPQAAAPAGRGVQVARSRSSAEADLLVHVVDARRADPEAQIDAVRDVLRRDRRRRTCPSCSCSTRPTSHRDEAKRAGRRPPGLGRDQRRHRRGHRRAARARSATGCGRSRTVVELLVPYDRGDVLAAVHREGEVVSIERTSDDGMRVRARLSDASAGRLREFVRRPRSRRRDGR